MSGNMVFPFGVANSRHLAGTVVAMSSVPAESVSKICGPYERNVHEQRC